MKVADHRTPYQYSTSHGSGHKDLGGKGPQPNNALEKKADPSLSLQGTVAGQEHYAYSKPGHSGFSGKRKKK